MPIEDLQWSIQILHYNLHLIWKFVSLSFTFVKLQSHLSLFAEFSREKFESFQ